MVDYTPLPTGKYFRPQHSPLVHGITVGTDNVLITFNGPKKSELRGELNRDKAVSALMQKGFTLEINDDDLYAATRMLPPTGKFQMSDVTALLQTLNETRSPTDNTPLLHADDVLSGAQFLGVHPTMLPDRPGHQPQASR